MKKRLLLTLLITSGCLRPPVSETPPTFSLDPSWEHSSTPSVQTASQRDWWEVFEDNQLNAIIKEGLSESPTIKQYLARFDQTLYYAKMTGADRFPELSFNGYGSRRRIPKDLRTSTQVPTGEFAQGEIPPPIPIPTTGLAPIVVPAIPKMEEVRTPKFINNLIANLLITYELDFWGKYYLKTQAAHKRAEASEADLASARLLLVDQIASAYFTLQALSRRLELIDAEIALHQQRIDLLELQCEKGLKEAFEPLDELARIESKRQEQQALIQSREVMKTMLAVLVGKEPNSTHFTIAPASWSFPKVAPGLPASLLANRPDVQRHMKEIESLIADIGAAKTELLPAISLSGAAGYQATVAHEWFKWKNRIWSLASSIAQPLFDAGRRFAQVDAAKAQFREATAALTQTVLSSVKEVEDALSAIETQTKKRAAALAQEEARLISADLRSQQLRAGLKDQLIVLQAQEEALKAKRTRIDEEFNLQLSTLTLMKSLGGSWE